MLRAGETMCYVGEKRFSLGHLHSVPALPKVTWMPALPTEAPSSLCQGSRKWRSRRGKVGEVGTLCWMPSWSP